jgi:hypothetical protein
MIDVRTSGSAGELIGYYSSVVQENTINSLKLDLGKYDRILLYHIIGYEISALTASSLYSSRSYLHIYQYSRPYIPK